MSSFEAASRSYIEEFQKQYLAALKKGSTSSELVTRPRVHKFIEDLIAECKPVGTDPYVHHDTRVTSRDRPDWTIEDIGTLGTYFYGDHKNLNLTGNYQLNTREIIQLEKYLSFGRPVFIFDGIEFSIYSKNALNVTRVSLIPKPLDPHSKWSAQNINPQVQQIFHGLLKNPGFRKWSEEDLIRQLALYAQRIKTDFEELLNAPEGSGSNAEENFLINQLSTLRNLLREGHDRSLASSSLCASFVAQVLAFGLFYAHTNQFETQLDPKSRAKKILGFWANRTNATGLRTLRPISEIAKLLFVSVNRPNVLSVWYQEVSNFLAHAEYMGTLQGPTDFHVLFETFLIHFDPKARYDYGAFYTPKVLTTWMVDFVDRLSKNYFGDSFLKTAERVVDPCCGTGGFLESILMHSQNQTEGRLPQLIGLEILPAPYALSQYRIDEVLKAFSFGESPQPLIFLTDSLSDNLIDVPQVTDNPFNDEIKQAARNTRPPLQVVIGNPPSTFEIPISSPRAEIRKMLEDFRPPTNLLLGRQNIQKALNNEAWGFLRWSCQKVLDTNQGIVALVLPGAFATHVTFSYARKWLLDKFDHIFILVLDEDARRSIPTQSLFNVLQGRIVLMAVLENSRSQDAEVEDSLSSSKVFHLDISRSTRDKKVDFLSKTSELSEFAPLAVSGSNWIFTPRADYDVDLWKKSWPLMGDGVTKGIFLSKCSAVKLAPSSALFHVDESILRRRGLDLARTLTDSSVTIERFIMRWFRGQRKPPKADKFTLDVQKEIVAASKDAGAVRKYLYRPFVQGHVLYRENLFKALSSAPGGGTRSRPEVRNAFDSGAIGIALAPSPEDIGLSLHRFATFAWELPDNDVAARGNAMVYSTVIATPTDDAGLFNVASNASAEIVRLFPNRSDDYIFYVYAVISSNVYKNAFQGRLFSTANPSDPIRVPIVADREVRNLIVEFGRELASLERFDGKRFSNNSLDLHVAMQFDLGTEAFRLETYSYDPITETITLHDAEGKTIQVSGLSEQSYVLRISGHFVVDRWLRYRTFAYLNRSLTQWDLEDLADLISRIECQFDCIANIDRELSGVFTEGLVIPPLGL